MTTCRTGSFFLLQHVLLVGSLPLLICISSPEARTWHIRNDTPGDAPTIQGGIELASPGDTVLVYPGSYSEAINFKGKDITVLGRYGSSSTILDGSTIETRLVTFEHNETQAAILEGFTIKLARAGAIICFQASPTIRNNNFVDNLDAVGGGSGGAITLSTSSAVIDANVFEGNECSGNGGCLSIYGDSPIIRNNVFRNNRSAYDGGAILLNRIAGSCFIEGNEFWSNVGGDHGGAMEIWSRDGTVVIRNNLFVDNVAKGNDGASDSGTGGGLSMRSCQNIFVENNTFVASTGINWASCTGGAILLDHVTNCTVSRNIFSGSRSCAIVCYATGFSGRFQDNLFWDNLPEDIAEDCPSTLEIGNLHADPMFCDPQLGNYRLDRDSPALSGSTIIGAFPNPGCQGDVAVISITWGRLKAKYDSP